MRVPWNTFTMMPTRGDEVAARDHDGLLRPGIFTSFTANKISTGNKGELLLMDNAPLKPSQSDRISR